MSQIQIKLTHHALFYFFNLLLQTSGNGWYYQNSTKSSENYEKCKFNFEPGVVPCNCNPDALEAEFRNGVGLIPVRGNSPSMGGWIVWPPAIQQKERSLNKYWDPTDNKPRF